MGLLPKLPTSVTMYNNTKSPHPLGGCAGCQHRKLVGKIAECTIVNIKAMGKNAGCMAYFPKTPLPEPPLVGEGEANAFALLSKAGNTGMPLVDTDAKTMAKINTNVF